MDTDHTRCYQMTDASSRELFDAWMANWSDLVDFEVTPVVTSQEAADHLRPRPGLPRTTSSRYHRARRWRHLRPRLRRPVSRSLPSRCLSSCRPRPAVTASARATATTVSRT